MLEASFHEAIRSGDSASRLIYADWLEEKERLFEAALLRSRQWCLIPAGSFRMGGGGGKPGKRRVEIPNPFYLGTYPVTQAEWVALMGSNPSEFSRTGGLGGRIAHLPDEELQNFPVEFVTWDDTQEYLANRNGKEKLTGWRYRLPTEAEWEYACRGAVMGKEESSFHYYAPKPSNDLSSQQANFQGTYPGGNAWKGPYLQRPTRVGSYLPNRLGLFDMHGNVSEWCTDILEGGGSDRVMRGGNWCSSGQGLRAGIQHRNTSTFKYSALGFRVALVPV